MKRLTGRIDGARAGAGATGAGGEMAVLGGADHAAGQLPNLAALRARFTPDPAVIPHVTVARGSLAHDEALLGAAGTEPACATGASCATEAA